MFIFVPASSLQSSHNQYTTPHSQFRQAWAQLLEAAPRHAIKPWFLRQKVSSPKMQWFKIWKDTETMVFRFKMNVTAMRLRIVGVYVAICCNMLQYVAIWLYGQYRVYLWTWCGQEAPQATPAEPLRQEGNLGCHGAVIYGHLHRSSQHFCPSMSILSMLMLLAPVLELSRKMYKIEFLKGQSLLGWP